MSGRQYPSALSVKYDMNNSLCVQILIFACGQKHGITSTTHDKRNAVTHAIIELYANLSALVA